MSSSSNVLTLQPHAAILATPFLKKAQEFAYRLTGRRDVVFSQQQLTWFQFWATGKGSGLLSARAGTGKTFAGVIGALLAGQQVLFLVFSKKIAQELNQKLQMLFPNDPDLWKRAQAKTCHSLGFGALRKAFGKVEVNDQKVKNILVSLNLPTTPKEIKELFTKKELEVSQTFANCIDKLVGFAKQSILGVRGSIEDESEWFKLINQFDVLENEEGAYDNTKAIIKVAIEVLKLSNKDTKIIDFNDQIYLPLLIKEAAIQYKFPIVIMDEAQDANPARIALARAALRYGGRFGAMGDPHQAIMMFAGALSDALERVKRAFACEEFPLTYTYRCGKNIVRFANQWVADYFAHDSNKEGSVESVEEEKLIQLHKDLLVPGNAMVCRNTAPLVEMAFKLIRQGVGCAVEGREIGNGLIALAMRWKKAKSLTHLKDRLDDYLEKQVAKLTPKGEDAKLAAIQDKVETLGVIIEQCQREKKDSVSALVQHIQTIFADTIDDTGKIIKQTFLLLTGHKSKGLEWKTVFWLDRLNTCPSKWARKKEALTQEDNLCYVMATRAIERLIEVVCPPKAKAATA